MKFKELGWNGILLEIPEEMRLTTEGGSLSSGYLKFEMENFLMEIRWDPIDPKKVKPLAEIADSFLKTVKKALKKTSKKEVDLKVKETGSSFVSSHNAYFMVLKPRENIEEPVYIWICDKSKRAIIIHFTSLLPSEEGRSIIGHIINSLKCHMEEEFVPWIALNLRFNIPSSFLLSDRRIAVGRTYLTFNEQKFSKFAEIGRKLMIEYFSMANVIFEDTYRDIESWFQNNYWKDLKKRYKNITFQTTETKRILRHNVVYRRGIKNSGLFTRRTTMCENLTWYCSKSNRIYSVTYLSYVSRPFFLRRKLDEETDRKIMQEFLSSLRCHI